jgi:hypothetical protein
MSCRLVSFQGDAESVGISCWWGDSRSFYAAMKQGVSSDLLLGRCGSFRERWQPDKTAFCPRQQLSDNWIGRGEFENAQWKLITLQGGPALTSPFFLSLFYVLLCCYEADAFDCTVKGWRNLFRRVHVTFSHWSEPWGSPRSPPPPPKATYTILQGKARKFWKKFKFSVLRRHLLEILFFYWTIRIIFLNNNKFRGP